MLLVRKIFFQGWNLFVVIYSTVLLGCSEEPNRGPLYRDTFPPSPLKESEVSVVNIPGGARIEYEPPDEEDALLVVASFERNGKMVTAKSSVYKNTIVIEGLKGNSSQKVTLFVVDRSDNRSEPITVEINPLVSPLDTLFETFNLYSDFGGVKLVYDNSDEVKVEVLLYTIDDNGNKIYQQSAFIDSDEKKHFTFRPFPPENQLFGIEAIDRWDNVTNFLVSKIKPLVEEKLNNDEFEGIKLVGDQDFSFGWPLENLFDGDLYTGFHTSQTEPGFTVSPYEDSFHMFTFDIGVAKRLSRIIWWQRQDDWVYYHGNPRIFDLWGIDEIPDDKGASLDGWTKLVDNGVVVKPSGLPVDEWSTEDVQVASRGEEFEIDSESSIRYIRFVNIKNWANAKFIHIMEIDVWGEGTEDLTLK